MPFNSKKKKSSWCYSDFLIKVPLISLTFLYFPVSVLKELSIIFIMEKENSHLKWLDIWKIVCLEHIKINLWIVVSFLLSDQKKKRPHWFFQSVLVHWTICGEVSFVVTVGTAQGEEMVEVLGGRYLVPTWNELWISNKEIKSHVKKLENKKAIEI